MKVAISTMTRHPGRLLKSVPFKLMLLLYSGTYFTANVFDTSKDRVQRILGGSTATTAASLGVVSAANVGLSIYKDSQFARTFGRVSARSLPAATYISFIARDSLTICGTFNLPQLLAPSFTDMVDTFASIKVLQGSGAISYSKKHCQGMSPEMKRRNQILEYHICGK